MSSTSFARIPTPGQTVAGCELHEEIGRGGTGTVYRATERSLGRVVAVKVLDPEGVGEGTARARFHREAESAARIVHPNVLPVHRVADDAGCMVLVMQYVASGTLYEALKAQGPPPLTVALSIVDQIARALDAGHAMGIVHRDVKPQNILLERSGHVWLADFGTVRVVGSTTATSLTGEGQLIGTIDYMAPEQIRGEGIGPATDIYGLACVTYRLLTGRVPYPREGAAARMHGHLYEPPPNPCLLRPDLPAEAGAEVVRAMAKDPDDRHATAGAFASALAAACDIDAAPAAESTVTMGDVWGLGCAEVGLAADSETTLADAEPPARSLAPAGRPAAWPIAAMVLTGIAIGATAGWLWTGGSAGEIVGDAGVSVEGPPGWSHAGGTSSMAALGVDDDPALARDPNDMRSIRLTAGGLGPVTWPDLLPVGWGRGAMPPVATGLPGVPGATAVLWRGVPAGNASIADAVVLATTVGMRGATCTGPSSAPVEERRECITAARNLVLASQSDALPPAPSAAFAARVSSALELASRALATAGRRMRAARTNEGERAAALTLSASLGRARVALGGAAPGLLTDHRRIAAALRDMRRSALALAVAARASHASGWDSANASLKLTSRRLAVAAHGLRARGYDVTTSPRRG